MKKIKWTFAFGIVLALTFAFTPTERYFEIAKSLDIYATLFKEVNTYYVDDVDPKKLVRKSIDSMLESLDPYTDFIPEDEIENFRVSTTGQYAGIGALIGEVGKKTVITHPYRNFPAFKAGVRVGDEIIAIDGKDVEGKPSTDVSSLLKGPAKTEVELRVRRNGQAGPLTFKIRRERITISNLAYVGMASPDVGFIKLTDFAPGASREVVDAVNTLKHQGARKIILDVRDNPGGFMHEAINIVNLFIPKDKEVVSTKGKVSEWNKSYSTLNNPLDLEIPLVVLISEGSASASEIVAGSLQDYDRAVLVGRKTFGKGLVQTTRQLSYNAQLKVTTAKYFIPSGRCIQALDYAHRNDDGSVNTVPDSLRKVFSTKNGRKVLDGNGIDPDVMVDNQFLGAITIALLQQDLIFRYASKYCGENPTQPELKSFRVSDAEYARFVEWAKTQKFSYSTSLESSTAELTEAAKRERYFNDIESQLSDLKRKVESNKATDWIRFKDEIREILEQQIAFHYALTEGEAIVSLHRDNTVQEALRILSITDQYSSILSTRK